MVYFPYREPPPFRAGGSLIYGLLQAMSKLALRAQTVDIADLPLHRDLLAKNVLMTAQRNFCLSNSPEKLDSVLRENDILRKCHDAPSFGGGSFTDRKSDPDGKDIIDTHTETVF
jgi:hypothetical protein